MSHPFPPPARSSSELPHGWTQEEVDAVMEHHERENEALRLEEEDHCEDLPGDDEQELADRGAALLSSNLSVSSSNASTLACPPSASVASEDERRPRLLGEFVGLRVVVLTPFTMRSAAVRSTSVPRFSTWKQHTGTEG